MWQMPRHQPVERVQPVTVLYTTLRTAQAHPQSRSQVGIVLLLIRQPVLDTKHHLDRPVITWSHRVAIYYVTIHPLPYYYYINHCCIHDVSPCYDKYALWATASLIDTIPSQLQSHPDEGI